MKKINYIIQLVIVLMLTGCSHTVQTTSGTEYLAQYEQQFTNNGEAQQGDFDGLLKQAAAVEPKLSFPARIGLARIDKGKLSPLPEQEVEAWNKARESLGDSFGEFIPVSPLITELASGGLPKDNRWYYYNGTSGLIKKIRLGAARQHLDAVLIYEVFSTSTSESNLLSVANITIIGGFVLPSKHIKAEGIANALLIDVIQGYPYGTANTSVDKKAIGTSWGSWDKEIATEEKAKIAAAIKLTEEVEEMFKELRLELAETMLKN